MRKLLLLLTIVSLFSCKKEVETVLFTEAQPESTRAIQYFSRRITGTYQSITDSSLLIVSRNMILRNTYYDAGIKINDLDSIGVLKGDTLTETTTGIKVFVTRIGDSITWKQKYTDTIFRKSGNGIIKKYKGYYFINTHHKDEGWAVKKIKFKKGLLSISDVSADEDITKLELITETKSDSIIPRKMKLNKKQFRKFIRQNGFSDEEVFVKQQNAGL